jgi:L-fuconate dehydratase
MNRDPDYSAAYCVLETDADVEGHGFTFTLGHGNELCVSAIQYLSKFIVGRSLTSLTDNMGVFSHQLTGDSQFRWLGPEKGGVHLAAAALNNAGFARACRRETALETLD